MILATGETIAGTAATGTQAGYTSGQMGIDTMINAVTLFSGGRARCGIGRALFSQLISEGKFKRFTPRVNWYLTSYLRLEGFYGIGRLDRFNFKGNTQFFQNRLQLEF